VAEHGWRKCGRSWKRTWTSLPSAYLHQYSSGDAPAFGQRLGKIHGCWRVSCSLTLTCWAALDIGFYVWFALLTHRSWTCTDGEFSVFRRSLKSPTSGEIHPGQGGSRVKNPRFIFVHPAGNIDLFRSSTCLLVVVLGCLASVGFRDVVVVSAS
jgi:hypothetical protein